MTEIFNRRPRGARFLAALAAATTVGAMLPLFGTAVASAATTAACTPITGLSSVDALGRTADPTIKDVVLTWTDSAPSAGALGSGPRYEVEISPNRDFTNNIAVDDPRVDGARYEVPLLSFKHASYYWRVRQTGATCWSDDGATQPASFSTAWHDAPTVRTLNTGNPVSRDNLTFSWSPIKGASLYELDVYDINGAVAGQCFTDHTSYTPYDVALTAAGDDRSTLGCFGLGALGERQHYTWTVRAVDTTAVPLNGKPYTDVTSGTDGGDLSDAYNDAGAVAVTGVTGVAQTNPDGSSTQFLEGTANGGTTVTLTGRGFVAPQVVTTTDPTTMVTTSTTTYVTHVRFGAYAVPDSAITVNSGSSITFATPPALVNSKTVGGTQGIQVSVDKYVTPNGVLVTDGGVSEVTQRSKWTYIGPVTTASQTPAGELGPFASPGGSFSITEPAAATTKLATPVDVTTIAASTVKADGSSVPCTIVKATAPGADGPTPCQDTPLLTWSPVAGANGYRVNVFEDAETSQLVRAVDVHGTTVQLRDDLLDDQAPYGASNNYAYYVQIQACDDAGCGPLPAKAVGSNVAPSASFRKETPAPTLTPTDPRVPADAATNVDVTGEKVTNSSTVTLAWQDYLTSTGNALEAAQYRVQVSSGCAFNTADILQSVQTDQPEFTSQTTGYADGTYYWHVQAIDQSGNPLTFGSAPNGNSTTCSDVSSFRVDRTPPVATAATVAAPPANHQLAVSWSEHVNGFTASQLQFVDETTQTAVSGATSTVSADGQTAVVSPAPFLTPGDVYGVELTSAATTDDAGNPVVLALPQTGSQLSGILTGSFTAPPPPAASFATSADDTMTVTFDQPVLGLANTTLTVADISKNGALVPSAATTAFGQTISVKASPYLIPGDNYAVSIGSGVTDSTGLISVPAGTIATGTFMAPPAPTAAISIGPDYTLTVSYNQAVLGLTPGQLSIQDTSSSNAVIPASVSTVFGQTESIRPLAYLTPGHTYAVSIGAGVTDATGLIAVPANTIAAGTLVAPAAPVAVTLPDGPALKLHFNQPVTGLSGQVIHLVDDAANVDVPSTISVVDAADVDVTPSVNLISNRQYSLRTDAGIADATGLIAAVSGPITGSIKSPFPPGINAAHSKEGIYTATVDQGVSGFTPDKIHLYTASTNVDVPASVVVNGLTATLTAAVKLVPGESYGLRVDDGIVGLDHVAVPSGPIPGTFREGTKEDSDQLTRSGHWGNRLARGSYNGSALVSGTGNPSLSGRFRSSVLTVAYCVGPMDGYLSISIDGRAVKTFNTRNAFTACGKKLAFRGFSGAVQHTVTFKKTGKKGSATGGSQVVLDYINAG